MLYILPPPSSPSPPSPWPNILSNTGHKKLNVNDKDTDSSGADSDNCISGPRRQFAKSRSAGSGTSVIERWLNSVQQNSLEKHKRSSSTSNIKNGFRSDSGAGSSLEEDEQIICSRSLDECYFAGKSSPAIIISSMDDMCQKYSKCKDRHRHYHHHHHHHHRNHHHSFHQTSSSSSSSTCSTSSTNSSSAVTVQTKQRRSSNGCDIQQHLQSMFSLLRPEETLKMAVKLESIHPGRTRYLVVVSCVGRNQLEECCLLGIDCNQRTTVGLVLRVLADTTITLDGDGGFSVSVCGRQHIFKPVSVQAMWSALQTLHKVNLKAREYNYFEGGVTHEWVSYYEQRIESDRSCLNEWHAMNDLESKRPPSPDSLRSRPRERLETERVIRNTLKEIMMSVDLDEVTSKYIRSRLEEQLDMDLREFKSFIDEEMLVILGQMDAATEIFPHVYLGSEWNASNLEELNKNGVCHILNVTREIDNFFPGMFDYLNVRVYDDDNTDLLKHWDNTFKYINKAKKEGSKVLVHCKMGISRSASVVIAYAMKAYNWDLKKSVEYVRKKRSCIKPNANFITQLETYQGILDAMKNKEKLQRSKSETNLKCSSTYEISEKNISEKTADETDKQKKVVNDETSTHSRMLRVYSGSELAKMSMRPKSWSPDNLLESEIYNTSGTMSQSLEHLSTTKSCNSQSSSASSLSTSPPNIPPAPPLPPVDIRYYNSNVRMPCGNGLTYSVSQNKIVQLYSSRNRENNDGSEKILADKLNPTISSNTPVITRKKNADRRGLVLNLTSQFESNKAISPPVDTLPPVVPNTGNLVKKDASDPIENLANMESSNNAVSQNSKFNRTTIPSFNYKLRKDGDLFSNHLDRVFDREEKKQQRLKPMSASVSSGVISADNDNKLYEITRQSSWSSYDSAVILGYQGEPRNCVSRHSSWGSCDTKCTLSSCHSSWGSYDLSNPSLLTTSAHCLMEQSNPNAQNDTKRSADIENNEVFKQFQIDPLLQNSNTYNSPALSSTPPTNYFTLSQPNIVTLSAIENTSPCIIDTTQCSSVRYHTTLLEKLSSQTTQKFARSNSSKEDDPNRGIVSNLKKEFEAKCQTSDKSANKKTSDNAKSLPSSPVSEHAEYHKPSPAASMEDLSVRKLVGKYEVAKNKDRTKIDKKNSFLNKKSSELKGINMNSSITKHPPLTVFSQNNSNCANNRNHHRISAVKSFLPTPNEIRTTVTKAANKLQQSKNHPLSKITFCKSRLNNSVYNTM